MMLKQFGQADSHESKLFLTYALGLSVLTILIGQGLFMIQKLKTTQKLKIKFMSCFLYYFLSFSLHIFLFL